MTSLPDPRTPLSRLWSMFMIFTVHPITSWEPAAEVKRILPMSITVCGVPRRNGSSWRTGRRFDEDGTAGGDLGCREDRTGVRGGNIFPRSFSNDFRGCIRRTHCTPQGRCPLFHREGPCRGRNRSCGDRRLRSSAYRGIRGDRCPDTRGVHRCGGTLSGGFRILCR